MNYLLELLIEASIIFAVVGLIYLVAVHIAMLFLMILNRIRDRK